MGVRRGIIVIVGIMVALACARLAMIRPTVSSTRLRLSVPGIHGTLSFESNRGACPATLTEASIARASSDQASPDAAWLVRRADQEDRQQHRADGLVLAEAKSGFRDFIRYPGPAMPAIIAITWSPDSTQIAFLAASQSQPEYGTVYVARLDTLTATAVAAYTGPHHALAWSPDSTTLAYINSEVTEYMGHTPGFKAPQIWIIPADASRPPAALAEGCQPEWTADQTVAASGETNGR